MDEGKLKDLYREIAARDAERAPAFDAVLARAHRAQRLRVPVFIGVGFAAVAAAVALLVVAPQRSDVALRPLPAPPLEFLLDTPGHELLAGVPTFGLDPYRGR